MVNNPPRPRKRIGANPSPLKRGQDGSAFTKCEKCKKTLPVAAADMHDCGLDNKIKMSLECHLPNSADRDLSSSRSKKRKNNDVENSKTSISAKKPRGPQEPKKPLPAYHVFMTEFRKNCIEDNAGSTGVNINKQGCAKWKTMTEEEKKTYIKKAEELQVAYVHALTKYHEELRQFNEEGDSAEVGIIDWAWHGLLYEDDLYGDESASETDDE